MENKVYISTAISSGYDRMVYGSLVPNVYKDHDTAVAAVRQLIEEDDYDTSYIDDITHTINTYSADDMSWEEEYYDVLDDEELTSNYEGCTLIMEVEVE